jgi:hypothetical protein
MNEPVVTLEADGQKLEADPRPAAPGAGSAAPGSGCRFTYASGSQPLAGYTIKRGLGHGGFGEVYFATSDAGKEVALKLIRRNLEVELRGIRHCLNLKHPNLLAIYDIREGEQGDNWVVMEYVTGQNLEDALAASPQGLPVEQALAWIHGIGAAVACLHDHGIVHRDLKPGNIFADEGLVKVGDYGLSKFISCSRRSGQTESVGTVHYMAPEVANGRYGKEIDIYAMGVILYEMLTGRVPFEGESVGEVLMKHLTAKPDVSMFAEPYRTVVAKALEKDPACRYASVPEMLAALPHPLHPQLYAGPWPSVAGARAAADPRLAETSPGAASPFGAMAAVEAVDEEPVLRAVRRGCRRMYAAWNESKLNTPMKILLLCVGLFAVLATAQPLLPLLVFALVVYGIYYLLRAMVLAFRPRRSLPVAPPPPTAVVQSGVQADAGSVAARPGTSPVAAHRADPNRWRQQESPLEALVLKPTRQRAAELLGSLVGSALVALTMALVMVILNGFRASIPRPEQIAWLAILSVAGAWAVLIPSKFWEGSRGEPMLRRFILMVIGLGLGLLAAELAAFLHVSLPYDPNLVSGRYELPGTFYQDGTPQALAYMACFGTLFLVVRWWRQADPLRSTRMSLWSMVFCVLVAWLTAALWLFPQPWLLMVACAMSVSVQLASPWVHPRQRRQPSNGR